MRTIQLLSFSFLFLHFSTIAQNFGGSGWCQEDHNINDSPWNAAIVNMKDAVFIFSAPYRRNDNNLVVYPFSCTGTLINQNTPQESLRSVFVAAEHCMENSKGWDHDENDQTAEIECTLIDDDITPWIFRFNYSSPGASNATTPLDARSAERYIFVSPVNIIRKMTVVDFAMCEITDPNGIPPHFNVYYQGWSTSLFQGLQLPNYAIHHPRRDIKKWSSSHSTTTYTDYACHTVTEIIDVVYQGLFGWWTDTEINTTQICNYIETPYWVIPIWTSGVVERGSSGSGLLNMQQRLIGVLKGGINGGCDFPVGKQFGKLSTAVIESPTVKNILEPNDFWALNADGRRITCYENLLDLNGQYFPAKDYQPENKIKLQATNEITTLTNAGHIGQPTNLSLHIRTGADFEFIAGNAIRIEEGTHFMAGSTVKMSISPNQPGIRIIKNRRICDTKFCVKICIPNAPHQEEVIYNFKWKINGVVKDLSQEFISTDDGPYTVSVEVTDLLTGEIYKASEEFDPRYLKGPITHNAIPSFVTPNGDGVSDVFEVWDGFKNEFAYNANYYKFICVNRGGQPIGSVIREKIESNFSSTGFSSGDISWDLKDKNGNFVGEGVYFCHLLIKNCTHEVDYQFWIYVNGGNGDRIAVNGKQIEIPSVENIFFGHPTPNPTSYDFSIQVYLKDSDRFRLVLLNFLGNEVMDLTRELRLINGFGNIDFHKNDLIPGVYQIGLISENFRQFRKLIILK